MYSYCSELLQVVEEMKEDCSERIFGERDDKLGRLAMGKEWETCCGKVVRLVLKGQWREVFTLLIFCHKSNE